MGQNSRSNDAPSTFCKVKGKKSIHFTIFSVNQLSIFGAVADLCK